MFWTHQRFRSVLDMRKNVGRTTCLCLSTMYISRGVAPSVPHRATGMFVNSGAAPTVIPKERDVKDTTLSTITTDTGAFAPGPRDFASYNHPGICVGAAEVVQATFHRAVVSPLVTDSSLTDTIGLARAAVVARACAARFPLATTIARDLQDRFQLALYEQNDTLAQRILTLRASRGPRDAILFNGLRSFLRFGRMNAATVLVAQSDSQGDRALREAMHVELMIAQGWEPPDRAEIDRVFQLIQQQPRRFDLETYGQERSAYLHLFGLAVWRFPDSLTAIARRAKNALSLYKDVPEVTQSFVWEKWPTLTYSEAYNHLAPAWFVYHRLGGGGTAPQLRGDYWFPKAGQSQHGERPPFLGKVNVLCVVGMAKNDYQVYDNASQAAWPQAQYLQHWLSTYGADAIEITLVVPAKGFAETNYYMYDVNRWRLFGTPQDEAHYWQWFIQEYERLPVNLAIQVPHSRWLPAPDGRRLASPKVQFNAYWANDPDVEIRVKVDSATGLPTDSLYGPRPGEHPGACTIVTPTGQIAWTGEDDREADKVLRWMFRGATSPGQSGNMRAASSLPVSEVRR